MRFFLCLLVLTQCLTLAFPAAAAEDPDFRKILAALAPKEAERSLECFQPRPGFRIELVCAEPLVSDPIAIDWGPDGRLWVVEMGGYPEGVERPGDASGTMYADEPMASSRSALGQGRVRFLEDTDQDGRYDSSTVFLDDLSFPTGVMVWGRGVLVTCAPVIFYAEDTNGDGKADRRETLFRGFVKDNPQHQVNGLRWGVDNWIYGANGDNGGTVTSLKTGEQVDIHARDFRFRMETGEFETQTGMAQYGRCRDDWGNWFGGRNLQPVWHCALDDQYLRRNSFLVPPDPCVHLMDPPSCAPVFPVSSTLPRFNEFWTRNRFTAACGITVYRDNLFGPGFFGNIFICEPTYNLVHRSVVYPRGVTFFSRRAADEQQSEFLASTDHWFRPVQARTGPDGALWIVDMYRLVIEHPDFIPEKWHKEVDFQAGRGRGRIYRVLPRRVDARRLSPLSALSADQLVSALDHPNGPRRDMIQQIIVRSRNRAAVGPLRRLVLSANLPQARLSAICTLDGLDAVDAELLLHVLDDPHPAVRRHAIRLAEPMINDSAMIQRALLERRDDPDAQVRMQLAYTLGQWDDRRAGAALARIARRDAGDPLMMAAVMSSATEFPDELLSRLVRDRVPSEEHVALIGNLLRLVLEAEQYDALALGLKQISDLHGERYQRWQYTLLGGLIDALESGGQSFREFSQWGPVTLQESIHATADMFRQANEDVLDTSRPDALRVEATRLVGRSPTGSPTDPHELAELLVPQTPVDVQIAVVNALARLEPPELPAILLRRWAQHGPDIRPRVIDILLSRERWTLALLQAIEAGEVAANELGATNRNRLILHRSATVRRLASQLIHESTPAERQETIARFSHLLGSSTDVDRGRDVYREHCAICHQLEDEGTNVGPDLLSQTDRDPESLLVSILDPNRTVRPRYAEYSVLTMDGRVLVGIVASETGNSVTLVDAQGVEHKLVRSDVDELISTGQSLMPKDVEQLLASDQDLLDLIAYIRSVEADPASKRPGPAVPVPQ